MGYNRRNAADFSFWMLEAALLIAAGFFAFALIGYTTISIVFISLAFLALLYRLIGAYSKRNEKCAALLKLMLTIGVCIALAGFVAVEILIIAAARTDEEPQAPYLIVLGAGVNGTVPSLSLQNRLTAAKDYLDAYPESMVIVSGGQGPGEEITEARCMFIWLTEHGIEKERIVLEEKSSSTNENLIYSFEKIIENGGDPSGRVALVSSEYHLYRAKFIARELGAQPLGVAGRTSKPVLKINYFIREAAAVASMWIM